MTNGILCLEHKFPDNVPVKGYSIAVSVPISIMYIVQVQLHCTFCHILYYKI